MHAVTEAVHVWTELIFIVARERVEAWSDALLECGASSVQVEDADTGSPDEEALFGEPGEPAPPSGWRRSRLAAMLDDAADARALLAQAAAAVGRPPPQAFAVREVVEQDWVRATQAQFEPIPVGRRLLIAPSWHLPVEPADAAGSTGNGPDGLGRVAIEMDPGLAFGTGSHATTHLCLEWLEQASLEGQRVIDYGCGSGILAIAAARLGAARIVAVDIDPQALESTRTNARVNDVAIETCDPSAALPEQADVVVANILANPLRVLAPIIGSLVRPGGRLVLGGLL
ncbi:MAG: 50S ribosomal protein L11 methyltransferase, partial [Gammaproteobacteria bacterium]